MIRIGIIGCGGVARTRHIPGIQRASEKARLAGFCDADVGRAADCAACFGGRAFNSLTDLLADDAVDAVIVCTPAKSHREIVVQALQAGKHVLCEKPMAVSEADAQAMIVAEQASGCKLMISHNQRFYEPHIRAKMLLESGAIGRLISFRTFNGIRGPEYSSILGADHAYFDRKMSGRGVMSDVGSHRVDLMRFMLGCDYRRVFSYTPTLEKKDALGRPIEVDDNAMSIVEMDNGAVGVIITSWTSMSGNDRMTQLFGTAGVITIYGADAPLVIELLNGERSAWHFPTDASQDVVQITDIDERFVDCILRDEPPAVTSADGLAVIRCLDAMERSNQSGQWIRLGKPDRAP